MTAGAPVRSPATPGPLFTRRKAVDAGIALSLANLCFLNVWTELLDSTTDSFLRSHAPPLADLFATVGSILVLAVAFYAMIGFARRLCGWRRVTAEAGFIAAFLIPLNIVRTQFLHLGLSDPKLLAPALLAAFAAGWAVLRWRPAIVHGQSRLILLLLPLFPLACAQVVIQRASGFPSGRETRRDLSLPRLHAGQARPFRVVWMIFDEFDACLAFSNRSPALALPALDRLEAESLYSNKAIAPARNTIVSIPSLITGKAVEKSAITSASELRLLYRGASAGRPWSQEPNVFGKAYASGFNTAVAGWFLPYCRIFPLVACQAQVMESVLSREDFASQTPLPRAVWLRLEQQLVKVPGLHFVDRSIDRPAWSKLIEVRRESKRHAIREYHGVFEDACNRLADRDLDLLFVHWPTPHPLTFFDRKTGDFSVEDGTNYFDALALVDRTVARIRTVLEQRGDWDRTVFLVSSDHPLRADLLRKAGIWSREEEAATGKSDCSYIPFILKMPGQRQSLRYDRPFNTVATADLLLAILRGEVASAEHAAKWLDEKAPRS